MSNTDGEDTQRIKLTLKDAGYKYFTCPMCDGHGQIGQDQHDQNNKDVEAQIETVQELAVLREQLKELIPIAEYGVYGYMRRSNGTLNWGEQEQIAKTIIQKAKNLSA